MRDVLAQRRVRWFFVAQAQGSLGDGAGYVALVLLAYERIGSAWAATAVMLADLVPAMLLGPLFGALADRRGRLGCTIAADVVRAAAFAGLALVDGTVAMVALALVAGAGTALFRPASAALLPALTTDERLPAVNALQGMVREGGQLLGPAIAAGLLLVVAPEAVLGLNAATFAISALLLSRLGPRVRPVSAGTEAIDAETGGVRALLGDPRTRALLITSGAVTLAAGTMNVAELVLTQRDLAAGATGYAVLISAYGLGLVTGSMLVAGGPRYFTGLLVLAGGLLATALAPGLALALLTFALTGAGNGLFVVSNRVLLQRRVPERLHGRLFGIADSINGWGFGAAVIAGGALATTVGARTTFVLAGALVLAASAVTRRSFRNPIATPGLALAAH